MKLYDPRKSFLSFYHALQLGKFQGWGLGRKSLGLSGNINLKQSGNGRDPEIILFPHFRDEGTVSHTGCLTRNVLEGTSGVGTVLSQLLWRDVGLSQWKPANLFTDLFSIHEAWESISVLLIALHCLPGNPKVPLPLAPGPHWLFLSSHPYGNRSCSGSGAVNALLFSSYDVCDANCL